MTLTTLKYIYRVTRNPYLYSVKNFFLYLMWNVTSLFYFYIWVTKFCVLVSYHCNFLGHLRAHNLEILKGGENIPTLTT